jgi:hypothetical protein
MISGITFTQLRQFADRVEKLSGVKSVRRNLTDNMARVFVQYEGSGEDLADAISTARFGSMPVKVIGLSGSKIEINIGGK